MSWHIHKAARINLKAQDCPNPGLGHILGPS